MHFQPAICHASSADLHPFMNCFGLGNKIDNLSDTNPTFIGIVYKFPDLLTLYMHKRRRNS